MRDSHLLAPVLAHDIYLPIPVPMGLKRYPATVGAPGGEPVHPLAVRQPGDLPGPKIHDANILVAPAGLTTTVPVRLLSRLA